MQKLDVARLRRCEKSGTCWDIGNRALYQLCKRYPAHDDQEAILAKIWLIGRSYAAAIERRKKFIKGYDSDSFHQRIVGPQMLAARIDEWLEPLQKVKEPSLENAHLIIAAHKRLMDLFCVMSGLEKRSLASKYLHFHFPQLFYLYDSRAAQQISKITGRAKGLMLTEYDKTYATYFFKCLNLVGDVKQEHHISLNPRQLDNYLLGFGR